MINLISLITKIILLIGLSLILFLYFTPNLLFKISYMPSFVYSCENCSSELRFVVSRALEGNIAIHCVKCDEVRKFNLARVGNEGRDWYSVSIKNKRRRDEDGLYNESAREQALAS